MPVPPVTRPRARNLGRIPSPDNVVNPLTVLSTAPVIEHIRVSGKDDGTDSGLIQPSDWNDPHKMVLPAGSVVARDTTGTGPAQAFPLDVITPGPDGLHIPTTDYVNKVVQDAIALALSSVFTTGDICASVHWNKDGWLQLNGQTIGAAGSGAVFADNRAHDLFVLFWTDIFGVDWPINGGRGTSAEADWLAHKTIPLPDARGRTLAMVDQGAGRAPVLNIIGAAAGEASHALSVDEMPAHFHPMTMPEGAYAGGAGGYQPGGNLFNSTPLVNTGVAGGNVAHNNLQPTITIIYHIKM